ncbi:hypothetical protein [Legionella spiritensis]|uniref:hypothetical protein n=1 Tax=Legionella spiritensis TaxID=452 RepID=UPI000F6EED70|nr:hypothetical protein [Legionella spiritensis]VEG90950.1 Uncharacterised protein [Legionella spiritensis]
MEHYSDTYDLLKKLKDRTLTTEIKEYLESIERKVNRESFVEFIKNRRDTAESRDIMQMRYEYDKQQLTMVQDEIVSLQQKLMQVKTGGDLHDDDVTVLDDIGGILFNVKAIAGRNMDDLDARPPDSDYSNYTLLANKYATDYIPFNQSRDPFQSEGFEGYCWGHSHRYAEMASKGMLNKLTIASDAKLYQKFRENFTPMDIVFRRVSLQLHAMMAKEMRKEIWKTMKQLDETKIFNFNFGSPAGAHSTSLRMVDGGIEYYDNNYGAVRFNNREDATNFLAEHLINMAELDNPYFQKDRDPVINLMSVYVIPQKNNPHHSIFDDLPEAKIERSAQRKEIVCDDPQVTKTIVALFTHAAQLRKSENKSDQLKAFELGALAKELASMSSEDIQKRVSGILANKHHTLIANRGPAVHLLRTMGAYRSTTEELLSAVNQAAMKAGLRSQKAKAEDVSQEHQRPKIH